MSGALRVIGGKARGRRLKTVPGDLTRPITDRTKESLFNIIGGDIQGATLLDLFAGTGSVGIEALSRGAGFVRFIDIQARAVDTIRQNLLVTGLTNDTEILRSDAFAALERPVDRSFDYIYIAPPQYKQLWREALAKLDRRPAWLAEEGWIIVQIHPVEYEEISLEHFVAFDNRKYGSTLLIFFERSNLPKEATPEEK
jgi:16S rRNA (guanine(966)-N(2))-methyltransferase RsmD